MNSRQILWFGLAVAVVTWYALPASADEGMPSRATLQAMGLADAQIVADDQALAVRGLGYGGKGGAEMHFASLAGKHDGEGKKFDKGQYDGPDVDKGHKGPAFKKHHHDGKHGSGDGKHGSGDGKLGSGDVKHGFGDGKHGFGDGKHGFGDGKHGFGDGKLALGDGKLGFGGGKLGYFRLVVTVSFRR